MSAKAVEKRGLKLEPVERAAYELILHVIDGGIEALEPKISAKLGVFYKEALRAASSANLREQEVLDWLASNGYAKREVYSRYVKCPKCGSFRMLGQLYCPSCGSKDVERITLASHIPCGYIGTLEDMKKNDEYVCPKCGKELGEEGKDWLRLGSIYRCMSCGETFDSPAPGYKCQDCGLEFTYRELLYEPVYRYVFNLDELKAKAKDVVLALIADKLTRAGVAVELRAKVPGVSGLTHEVALKASRAGKDVFLEVISDSPTASSDMIAVYGKALDIGSPDYIILAPIGLGRLSRPGLAVITYETYTSAVEKGLKEIGKRLMLKSMEYA